MSRRREKRKKEETEREGERSDLQPRRNVYANRGAVEWADSSCSRFSFYNVENRHGFGRASSSLHGTWDLCLPSHGKSLPCDAPRLPVVYRVLKRNVVDTTKRTIRSGSRCLLRNQLLTNDATESAISRKPAIDNCFVLIITWILDLVVNYPVWSVAKRLAKQ